jgi:hypothetical protein
MGELARLAQKMSPWLKIADNDQVEVIYRGFELVDDPRNPGKQKLRYKVEVNGEEKWFESVSARVAMSFDSFNEGDRVIIQKNVENNKIRYFIKAPKEKTEWNMDQDLEEIDQKIKKDGAR